MALTDSLVSYWKLDEASGNALDAHGTNHLTDVNTVTSAAGKVGTARQFTAANSEYFTIPSNASLQTGDIDFTIAAWINPPTLSVAHQGIVGKWTGVAGEYLLSRPADASVKFWINGAAVAVASPGVLVVGTWAFVIAWHDSVANTVNIQVNNGTVVATSHAGGVTTDVGLFEIGNYNLNPWDGRIDELGFWKRVLTADERSALYAGGAGLTYPFGEGGGGVGLGRPARLGVELGIGVG